MQGLQASQYKSVVDCASQILRNEARDPLAKLHLASNPASFMLFMVQGPRAFYKGATARLARVCLDVTVIMVLYDKFSKILDSVWPD
jgi:hypothetical protein